MMTKQDILDFFKDINEAYNNCNMLDSLSAMLDELMEGKQEIVQCKDCKNNRGYGVGLFSHACICYLTGTMHMHTWFCPMGKRKDDENE